MFSSRNFLLGLGLGLVISSLFYLVITPSSPNETPFPNQKQVQLSLDDLKAEASKYGYELYMPGENQQKQNSSTNPNEKQTLKQVEFFISKGSTSEEVTKILLDLHILDNGQAFVDILDKYDLSKKIRAGKYIYSSDMKIEDIVAMITNTKKEEW